MSMKFKNGGRDGSAVDASSLGAQFNDKFWSKVAVKEARKNIVFSQMGSKLLQPKNYGDTIQKYHELPILHELNVNDQGIDANGTKLISGKWFAYASNGTMTGSAAGYDTSSQAQAVAGATGSITSGDGNLFGGDTSYSVVKGAFPALREEGGIVNAIGMKRETLEAQVNEFGFHIPFTKKMLDMDTEKGLVARISREIGVAQAEVREAQVQTGLLDAGLLNAIYSGNATAMAEVEKGDLVTFTSIRSAEQSQKAARSPRQTKVIDGSTKVGTTTVGAGYYAYCGQELYPTLEDMTHAGVSAWRPVETYASAGHIAEMEIGKISATRFIEVEDMISFQGSGAVVAADADGQTEEEAVLAEAGLYHSSEMVSADGLTTTENYDIFPILYVGSDSFATVGFEGDVAKVMTAMPKIIPGVDAFGKNGLVSISWYYGMLIYRPERLLVLLTPAKI